MRSFIAVLVLCLLAVPLPAASQQLAFAVQPAVLQTPFGTTIKTSVSGSMPGQLRAFLNRVQAQCGHVTVISTFRRNAVVAGTRRRSCHAFGQAVDYQVRNPSCALRVAAGHRALGHTVDYAAVRHFHVSSCRQEAGARFRHGRTRYARRWR